MYNWRKMWLRWKLQRDVMWWKRRRWKNCNVRIFRIIKSLVASYYIPLFNPRNSALLLLLYLLHIKDTVLENDYTIISTKEDVISKKGNIEPVYIKNEYRRKYKYIWNCLQEEKERRIKRCPKIIIKESGAFGSKKPEIKESICKG